MCTGYVRRCTLHVRSKKGLVEIVPIFHTVFAHVYHYAISELCKGPYVNAPCTQKSDTEGCKGGAG